MSGSIVDMSEEYDILRHEIQQIEEQAEKLPEMRERMNELAERIKAYVSDPGLEPEPIEPMTDLSAVDYAPAFEGYQPNGSLPETD